MTFVTGLVPDGLGPACAPCPPAAFLDTSTHCVLVQASIQKEVDFGAVPCQPEACMEQHADSHV